MPRQSIPRPSSRLAESTAISASAGDHRVQEAHGALEATLKAGGADYDRSVFLRRFHRLAPETIESSAPEAARAILVQLERALRQERARIGHWTYDLNRHIGLLAAYRTEKARAERLGPRI